MKVLFHIVNVIGIIIEVLITISYFRFLSSKRQLTLYQTALLSAVVIVTQAVTIIVLDQQPITTGVMFLSIMVLSFTYRFSWIKRFLFSVLLMIMFILSEVLIGLLLSVISDLSVEQLSNHILYYIQGVLISKLIMFVIIRAFHYFSTPVDSRISGYLFIPLIILPIATFCITYVLSEYSFKDKNSSLAILSAFSVMLMIVSNILLFYLFEYQLEQADAKNRAKLHEQHLSYQVEYYKELSEKQRITNKAMHDLKNQVFALRESYHENPQKCCSIIDSISAQLSASTEFSLTGTESVDAMIYAKQQSMRAKNICFTHFVYLSNGTVDPFDMCVLLGNLLDNAIEANEKVTTGERFISLNMTQQQNYLSIHIQNAVAVPVIIDENGIYTTKKEKELHGFGLQSIKEITDKYHGNCSFHQDEKVFHVYVMLQNA